MCFHERDANSRAAGELLRTGPAVNAPVWGGGRETLSIHPREALPVRPPSRLAMAGGRAGESDGDIYT